MIRFQIKLFSLDLLINQEAVTWQQFTQIYMTEPNTAQNTVWHLSVMSEEMGLHLNMVYCCHSARGLVGPDLHDKHLTNTTDKLFLIRQIWCNVCRTSVMHRCVAVVLGLAYVWKQHGLIPMSS